MGSLSDALDGLLHSAELLPATLEMFGQSTQDAAANAEKFSQSATSTLSSLAYATGMGREAQHAIQAFQEFGPVVGTIIVALKLLRGSFELQTAATKTAAEDMNHTSALLLDARLFIDNMKKTDNQVELDQLTKGIADERQKLIEGINVDGAVSGLKQLADWASKIAGGEGFDGAEGHKTMIKDLTNQANVIKERMRKSGDTGTEAKAGSSVQSMRAVQAADVGSFKVDHSHEIDLLAQIAANTANIGTGAVPQALLSHFPTPTPVRGVGGVGGGTATGNVKPTPRVGGGPSQGTSFGVGSKGVSIGIGERGTPGVGGRSGGL